MRKLLAGLGMLLVVGAAAPASATSISVAPTTIDLTNGTAASRLTLKNSAKAPVSVQVRVFRWSQENGVERLEPTKSVVASPPSAKLAAGQEYTVRVVRVSKAPTKGEEAYRVLVDELPQKTKAQNTVNLVVRQSIPVFFTSDNVSAPDVTWTVGRIGGQTMLTARNEGGGRLKISDLSLLQGGKAVGISKGLVGYVLGGSTMSFPIAGKTPSGTKVAVKANSNLGPFNATATVRAR